MKRFAVLGYAEIMAIADRDRQKRARRAARHVKLQNWAARHGYRFWNRLFNLITSKS